jgi:hypothetical protein
MRDILLKFIIIIIISCFLLAVIPVSAVKSTEQSVGGSITRGSRFTVTITGLPNSSYYIWIPHTSTMTGEPHDQPPVISDSQMNVMQDPVDGPWPIGSYPFNNGDGMTIRDDIPPSTADMPNIRYYALVTTNNEGQATVEFLTSFNTKLRSYSVKVESPKSIDSDNLLVELHVRSRSAPAPIEIFTPPQPIITTVMPTTTEIPEPVTTVPVSTIPIITTAEPVQTSLPVQTPTQKAPITTGTGIFAAGLVFFLKRRR